VLFSIRQISPNMQLAMHFRRYYSIKSRHSYRKIIYLIDQVVAIFL
jgi:hypothetical protein